MKGIRRRDISIDDVLSSLRKERTNTALTTNGKCHIPQKHDIRSETSLYLGIVSSQLLRMLSIPFLNYRLITKSVASSQFDSMCADHSQVKPMTLKTRLFTGRSQILPRLQHRITSATTIFVHSVITTRLVTGLSLSNTVSGNVTTATDEGIGFLEHPTEW